jgi:7-cyano-7-deazaguanine synthase
MKAIVLFSGGLDSTVLLAMALENKRDCVALSFDYGQRHRIELNAASAIANYYHVKHKIITIDSSAFCLSSLVSSLPVPKDRSSSEISITIANTYVPARNTLFLAHALAHAELHEAHEIYIGPNALDIQYTDCRPEYYTAFQQVAHLATRQGVDGKGPLILTPLIHWNKKQIIEQGLALNAPLDLTFSCYDPTTFQKACGRCDACILRQEGFSSLLQKQPQSH